MFYNFIRQRGKGETVDTYADTKDRILFFLEQTHMSIYALSMKSRVSPSTIKSILYGKSQNPGVVTIKLLCDGFGISLFEFFNTDVFRSLELEDL